MITPKSAMRIFAPVLRRAKCPLFLKDCSLRIQTKCLPQPIANSAIYKTILSVTTHNTADILQTKCLITQNTFFFEMESHRILESPAATIMFTLVEESLFLWSQVQSPDATIIFITIRLVVRIRQFCVVSCYEGLICHMCFCHS